MNTRPSARPAHGVASVRYYKGWLSPERSLVITSHKTSPPLLGLKAHSPLSQEAGRTPPDITAAHDAVNVTLLMLLLLLLS